MSVSNVAVNWILSPARAALGQKMQIRKMEDSERVIQRIGAIFLRLISALICAITFPLILGAYTYQGYRYDSEMAY